MQFFIPFQVFVWLIACIFVSRELDMGRMMEARTIVQGGLDAAVLAGAHMQERVPTAYDSFGYPKDWKMVIDPDVARAKALETWMDNVEHYYSTPLYDLASVTNVTFTVSPDQTEITGNMVLKMKQTASVHFIKSAFGETIDFGEVEIPVKAVAVIKPEDGNIITP